MGEWKGEEEGRYRIYEIVSVSVLSIRARTWKKKKKKEKKSVSKCSCAQDRSDAHTSADLICRKSYAGNESEMSDGGTW